MGSIVVASAPRQPEPCTPPNPYPVSGTSSFPAPPLSELNKQESLFVLAIPAAAGAQIKPCLNYFYWLRRPRPLISITVTGRKGPEAARALARSPSPSQLSPPRHQQRLAPTSLHPVT